MEIKNRKKENKTKLHEGEKTAAITRRICVLRTGDYRTIWNIIGTLKKLKEINRKNKNYHKNKKWREKRKGIVIKQT